MKRMMGAALAGLLVASGTTGAWAAGCATAKDVSALETAALQQELMVAAFSCHAIEQYNGFVLAHRPELMDADARLKAYFVRTSGGDAGYHTYKTELANASSLRSLHDADSFCADANDDFETASDGPLSAALDAHPWLAASYPACTPGVAELAAASPPPRAAAHSDRHAGGMDGDLSAPAPHRRLEADSL